ncbi:hypothetical protein [Streptomyces sp. NPDC050548]|uniref:hypothetical protein n=1 Tax=Streptomyces sp. NPDC050548 TaxID=3365629 RepID=UPI003791915E
MITIYVGVDDATDLRELVTSTMKELEEDLTDPRGNGRIRPPAVLPPLDPAMGTDALVLRMIKRIQDTRERFEEENVYLRSICPDCLTDGKWQCSRRTGDRRDDAADVAHSSMNLISRTLLMLARACGPQLAPITREALLAALTARNAAIEGDHATVDEFGRIWLGITRPERWREAVEMALLGDWVDRLGRGVLRDPAVVDLLRRHTEIEHRHLQPLWERKVNGSRVSLLSRPVGTDLTLRDLLVEVRTPEAQVLHGERESRVAAVLRRLTPEEATVAATWPRRRNSAGGRRRSPSGSPTRSANGSDARSSDSAGSTPSVPGSRSPQWPVWHELLSPARSFGAGEPRSPAERTQRARVHRAGQYGYGHHRADQWGNPRRLSARVARRGAVSWFHGVRPGCTSCAAVRRNRRGPKVRRRHGALRQEV